MQTIDLPDDELRAAAIRDAIESDRYPLSPRLDPLRAALARLEATAEPVSPPKATAAAKGDKRGRKS